MLKNIITIRTPVISVVSLIRIEPLFCVVRILSGCVCVEKLLTLLLELLLLHWHLLIFVLCLLAIHRRSILIDAAASNTRLRGTSITGRHGFKVIDLLTLVEVLLLLYLLLLLLNRVLSCYLLIHQMNILLLALLGDHAALLLLLRVLVLIILLIDLRSWLLLHHFRLLQRSLRDHLRCFSYLNLLRHCALLLCLGDLDRHKLLQLCS